MAQFLQGTIAACFLAAVALVTPAGAEAATRYVAPGGTATNSGATPLAPWSLAKAIAAAQAGDTVAMAGGSYAKTVVSNVPRSGIVTFVPRDAAVPKIAGMELTSVDGLRFEDVTFTARVTAKGRPHTWQFVRSTWSLKGGIAFANFVSSTQSMATRGVLDDFHWEDSRFVAPAGAGNTDGVALLKASAQHTNLSFRNSLFRGLRGNGIKIHEIVGLKVEGNAFDRVMTAPGATNHSAMLQVLGPSDDVEVRRNFVNGGRGMIVQPDPATGVGATRRLVLEDNVFAGHQFGGRFYAVPGIRIVGNTFWSTSGDGTSSLDLFHHGSAARPGDSTTGVVLKNNLIRRIDVISSNFGSVTFADQRNNLIKVDDTARPYGPNTLVGVAPSFYRFTGSAAPSDMHLTPAQPRTGIIDGGADSPHEDCDGSARTGAPDLGGLESRSTAIGTGCAWQRAHPGG